MTKAEFMEMMDWAKEQTISDIYRFRRIEIRREILSVCRELITDQSIAEAIYMRIMNPLEDFLSDHEVKRRLNGNLS